MAYAVLFSCCFFYSYLADLLTMPVILFIGKKPESSKKIKDEPPVEPSFKVVMLYCTFISLALYLSYCIQ